MIDTKNLLWHELGVVNNIDENILSWLDDDKSLTAKLKQKFKSFAVEILTQEIQKPHKNELEVVDFSGDCVIREVQLLGDNQIVVFARSVIPITSDTEDLLKIGSKPLGEVLFNDKSIKRGDLQVTNSESTWGRRSAFTIGTTKLLVSEFFLENLYET